MIVNPGFGGADGKSAYQYAVEGGYAGSEAEFQALLGSGPWLPVKNYSNPNLLDNWYFPDPVNQRGMTEYTQRGYTVDRWFAYITDNIDDKISITNHGLHFHRADESDGSRFSFNQNLDPWDKYAGMTFTVSFLTTENLYAASFTVPDTKPAGEVYQILKQTELGMIVVGSWNELDALSVGLNKMNASILDFTLVAAKLELGVRQTLAHQDADGNWVLNDPPPNKALELAKCQRYQVVYSATLNIAAVGFASNQTSVLAKISCPPLRGVPTLNFDKLYLSSGTNAGANSIPVTRVTDVFGDNGSYYVQFKCEGGLTPKEAVAVQIRGGYLILDANL